MRAHVCVSCGLEEGGDFDEWSWCRGQRDRRHVFVKEAIFRENAEEPTDEDTVIMRSHQLDELKELARRDVPTLPMLLAVEKTQI